MIYYFKHLQGKNKLLIILCIVVLFCTKSLCSQNQQLALELGSGKNSIDIGQKGIINAFNNDLYDYYRFGVGYYYTNINAYFRLNSGINYEHRDHELYNLNYLKAPFGIELITQTKIQFIAGGGLYIGYLISYDDFTEPDLKKELNPWNFGVYGNVGLGYQLTAQYSINVQYQHNYDLSKTYAKPIPNPNGTPINTDYYGYDGYVRVTVLYTLSME